MEEIFHHRSAARAALASMACLADAYAAGTGRVSAEEIAQHTSFSREVLAKVLNRTVRSGLVTSLRGPHGGYRLARPPEEISLMQIIGPFVEPSRTDQCLLGRDACTCAFRQNLCDLRGCMCAMFAATTLREPAAAAAAPTED